VEINEASVDQGKTTAMSDAPGKPYAKVGAKKDGTITALYIKDISILSFYGRPCGFKRFHLRHPVLQDSKCQI
jgi:hypothetical protein